MRRYETIVIVDPDLSEDNRTSLFTRIKDIIPQQDGVLIEEDLWGARKLAYEIKKKPRGFYARFDYCGMGGLVDEMERFFRIDDRVMKYLTVQLDADADVDQIQAEMAPEVVEEEPAEAAATTAESETSAAPAQTEAAAPAKAEAQAPAADQAAAPAEPPEAETATETSEKE